MASSFRPGAFRLTVAALLGLFACGCASNKAVSEGRLKTPGVVIRSDGGEGTPFAIEPGKIFTPPFSVESGSRVEKWNAGNLVTQWDDALSLGARRVRVTVPGQQEPLYGVLLLSKVDPKANVPGTRSYLIEVPPSYVDAAQDGKISVVYESVPFNGKPWYSWILWMSDRPIRS